MLTWLDWFCRHSSESLAALPASASAAWQGTLSENQVVYIDVPHGAVLPEIKPGDVVELRVILAANYRPSPEGMQGQTLTFVALLTSRGSERGRGRLVGVLMPDGWTFAIASTRLPTRTQADLTLKAPFVDPEAEARARSKAEDFLRLVLASRLRPNGGSRADRGDAADPARSGKAPPEREPLRHGTPTAGA